MNQENTERSSEESPYQPSSFASQPEDPQRVDVERIEPDAAPGTGGGFAGQVFPGGIHVQFSSQSAAAGLLRPPVISTWICLALAWLFLGSKVPFTVFIGLPLDLAALLLAMVCLSRGGVLTGISVLVLGTIGSFVVYLVGLFRFLAVGL